MPTIRHVSRAGGAIHDVARLTAMEAETCNVLVVSDSTLAMITALGQNEITYIARYATSFLGDDLYVPGNLASASIDDILDLQRRYNLEVIPMTCDLVAALNGIKSVLETMSGGVCGCPAGATGTVPDPGTTIGGDAEDAPDGYEQELYDGDDKCSVSNWYWQQTILTLQQFLDYNVVGWLVQGVALAVTAILAIVALPVLAVFGAVFLEQLAAMTDIITALLPLDNDDLQDMIDAIEADQEGFVCALYSGEDIGGSQQNLEDWAQSAGLTAGQDALLLAILNNYTLAGLFYLKQSTLDEADAMTGKYDCSGCATLDYWTYVIQFGTGTIDYNGNEFTLTSELYAGSYFVNFNGAFDQEGKTTVNWCLEVTGYTIDATTHTQNRRQYAWATNETAAFDNWAGATPSMPPIGDIYPTSRFEVTDDSPFTVSFKIHGHSGLVAVGTTPSDNEADCA